MRGLVAALLLSVLGGCATVGTVQTARPIERGTTQFAVEPGVFGVEGKGWYPAANVAVRHGFGQRWDAGVRFGTAGLGVSTKVLLTDPLHPDLAVAIAPSVGGMSLGALGIGTRSVHGQLPLVIGLRVGTWHELVVAPKLQVWQLSAGVKAAGVRQTVVGAGTSLGVSLRVSPGLRIFPEVAMVQPVWGSGSARFAFWDVDIAAGRPLYTATIGILMGGERAVGVSPYRSNVPPPYYR